MEKLEREAVLVSLIECIVSKRGWCNECYLQKITYFVQQMLNVPLRFKFILYKDAPFSFDLEQEIVDMLADYILKYERVPIFCNVGLVPAECSERAKKQYLETIERYSIQIQYAVERFGRLDTNEIAQLGVAFYLLKKMTSDDDIGNLPTYINRERDYITVTEAEKALKVVLAIEKEAPKEVICV